MSGIIQATNIQTDNIKTSSGTSSMTIDGTGLVTGSYLKPTSEGLVTSTAAQDNIQFTVPAGCNRIEMQIFKLSPVGSHELYIRMGNPSIITSGYDAVSLYAPDGSATDNTAVTNAFRINGWNGAANIWNHFGWGRSIDDGRRWLFNFDIHNTEYPTSILSTRGTIDMGSGNTLQKLQISTSSSGGFDAGGMARVYYGKV